MQEFKNSRTHARGSMLCSVNLRFSGPVSAPTFNW